MTRAEIRQLARQSGILKAACEVLREAMDNVENLHPCDVNDDKVKYRHLSPKMQKLCDALYPEWAEFRQKLDAQSAPESKV